jgi:hypothetical protein
LSEQEDAMPGPEKPPADARWVNTHEAGIAPLDSLDQNRIEPVIPPAPVYTPEPLFNKKVMLAWALGAAAVWFTVKMIVPIGIESAKTAVRQAVKDAEQNPGTTVTITRNGRVITIKRSPETPPAPTPAPAPAARGGVPEKQDATRK